MHLSLPADTSATVLSMIKEELTKLDYELWQPLLGGPGVVCYTNKPDLFAVPNAVIGMQSAATSTITDSSSHSTPSFYLNDKKL